MKHSRLFAGLAASILISAHANPKESCNSYLEALPLRSTIDVVRLAELLKETGLDDMHQITLDTSSAGDLMTFDQPIRGLNSQQTGFDIQVRRSSEVMPTDLPHSFIRIAPKRSGAIRLDLILQPHLNGFGQATETTGERLRLIRDEMLTGNLSSLLKNPDVILRTSLHARLPSEAIAFLNQAPGQNSLQWPISQQSLFSEAIGLYRAVYHTRQEIGSDDIRLRPAFGPGRFYLTLNAQTATIEFHQLYKIMVERHEDRLKAAALAYRHLFRQLAFHLPEAIGQSESLPLPDIVRGRRLDVEALRTPFFGPMLFTTRVLRTLISQSSPEAVQADHLDSLRSDDLKTQRPAQTFVVPTAVGSLILYGYSEPAPQH